MLAFANACEYTVGSVTPARLYRGLGFALVGATWVACTPASSAAPETIIRSAPPPLTHAAQATFAFAATPPSTTFVCRLDDFAATPCTATTTLGVVADGTHRLAVAAIVGGVSDPTPALAVWTVDTDPPTTTILSAPVETHHQTTAVIDFTADEAATFACRLDAGAWEPCTPPHTLVNLSSGVHAFAVRARDSAGNLEAAPPGFAFLLDLPPDTSLTQTPDVVSEDLVATFAFTGNDDFGIAGFDCRLDGGLAQDCTSPWTSPALTEGQHTFAVSARDAAGLTDSTPATYTWTVDLGLPPQTVLEAAPSARTPLTTAVLRFRSSAADLAGFVCSDDGSEFSPCTSPHLRSGLTPGTYVFAVRALDQSGSIDPVGATHTWHVTLPTAVTWTSVAVEQDHACALNSNGSLWCWGSNAFTKLGLGLSADATQPTQVGTHSDWIAVATGRQHTCGLRAGGSLWCWGDDSFGQVGNGSAVGSVTQPQQIAAVTTWTALDAGAWHNCALALDGSTWCWGLGSAGRLGTGDETTRSAPTWVASMPTATTLSAGGAHSCAIATSGELYCWGANQAGQLGDGSFVQRNHATLIDTGPWQAVSAGGEHTCGIRGTYLMCWGANADGQLGDGLLAKRNTPATVAYANLPATSASGGAHTCTVAADGSLFCWGDNSAGQVGRDVEAAADDFATYAVTLPVAVGEETDWTAIAAGVEGSCGIRSGGSLWCWGRGAFLPDYAQPQTTFPAWVPAP